MVSVNCAFLEISISGFSSVTFFQLLRQKILSAKKRIFGCKIVFFGLCKHGLFQGLTMDRGDISMHINELLYLLFCTFYFPAKNK